MKEFYTINDLCLMTGLSDRTLRNYLNMGILKGDKKEGNWIFTAEQLEEFFRDEYVLAALKTKNNALVYDFLADVSKKDDRFCIIMDLKSDKYDERFIEDLCMYLSKEVKDIEFRFLNNSKGNRMIVSGKDTEVLKVIDYCRK